MRNRKCLIGGLVADWHSTMFFRCEAFITVQEIEKLPVIIPNTEIFKGRIKQSASTVYHATVSMSKYENN